MRSVLNDSAAAHARSIAAARAARKGRKAVKKALVAKATGLKREGKRLMGIMPDRQIRQLRLADSAAEKLAAHA